MTHAMTPDAVEQPTTTAEGQRIYGTVLPPSKKIPVTVRFWREDDPEVWTFSARPKLDITTLRRVGGLMQMAEIQQVREQRRRQGALDRAAAQKAGRDPGPATEQQGDTLPKEVLESVDDILKFVGGMMSDRDGVKLSWDPDPTPHKDYEGREVAHGKDAIPPSADVPSWAGGGTWSVRLPDGSIVIGDDPRVAEARSLHAASSKRRWYELVELDDEVELGLDAIMEMVGDLVGQWSGGEEGGRPLDEQSSSGTPPTPQVSASGSADASPSPA